MLGTSPSLFLAPSQDKRSTFCGTLDYLAPVPGHASIDEWLRANDGSGLIWFDRKEMIRGTGHDESSGPSF